MSKDIYVELTENKKENDCWFGEHVNAFIFQVLIV